MKSTFIRSLAQMLICVMISSSAFSLGWQQKTNFTPGNRYGAFSFSIGQKGYVGSGVIQVGTSITLVNDFWEYDPILDSWTQKATLPSTGRIGAATFVVLNAGFVTTGYNLVTHLNDNWKYDTAMNTWQAMSVFPGGNRYTCASFNVSDYGFVGMGYATSCYSDFYRYNPISDTWTLIAPIPGTARQTAKGFSILDYGYVVGGANEAAFYNCKQLWRYDPIGDVWLQKTDYPGNGSHGLSAFVMNDEGYVGAGAFLSSGVNNVFDDFFKYDPSLDNWTSIPDFDGGIRQGTVSMTINNRGYVGLGSTLIYPQIDYKSDWWTFTDPTGIEDQNIDENDVIAYFDSNHNLNINLKSSLKTKTAVEVFDANGKMIRRSMFDANQQNLKIENRNLSHGMYSYAVYLSSEKLISGKVIYLNNQ
ncbi:MAG: hypothetical protein IPP71_06810 [Bacteroidetes bacterium]|nr:hypothetical protein [Bacteroidota bacterium]